MAVSQKRIQSLIRLLEKQGSCSYDESNKNRFHRDAKAVCREIADRMGLEKGEYEVRSNKGGIAVSGEVTLHTDGVYFQLSQSVMAGLEIMYRKCNGRKDYSGGRNRWMKFAALNDLDKVAKTLKNIHEAANDQMADVELRAGDKHAHAK